MIDSSGTRIECDNQCPPRVLHADAMLLVRALSNLIRNSIDAMVEHGCTERVITLRARCGEVRVAEGRLEERIILSAEDTGPGIPAHVVSRMFNPFFTTRETGTGLGLAIVHRILDAHGGEVDVTQATGGGARVSLRLPPRAACSSETHAAVLETHTHTPARMAG